MVWELRGVRGKKVPQRLGRVDTQQLYGMAGVSKRRFLTNVCEARTQREMGYLNCELFLPLGENCISCLSAISPFHGLKRSFRPNS